jgi:hypothetical protein
MSKRKYWEKVSEILYTVLWRDVGFGISPQYIKDDLDIHGPEEGEIVSVRIIRESFYRKLIKVYEAPKYRPINKRGEDRFPE